MDDCGGQSLLTPKYPINSDRQVVGGWRGFGLTAELPDKWLDGSAEMERFFLRHFGVMYTFVK